MKTTSLSALLILFTTLLFSQNVPKTGLLFDDDAYNKTPKDKEFFGKTFTVHAGTLDLQKQIEGGMTAKEIRATWQKDVEKFKKIRAKYLIYN